MRGHKRENKVMYEASQGAPLAAHVHVVVIMLVLLSVCLYIEIVCEVTRGNFIV